MLWHKSVAHHSACCLVRAWSGTSSIWLFPLVVPTIIALLVFGTMYTIEFAVSGGDAALSALWSSLLHTLVFHLLWPSTFASSYRLLDRWWWAQHWVREDLMFNTTCVSTIFVAAMVFAHACLKIDADSALLANHFSNTSSCNGTCKEWKPEFSR